MSIRALNELAIAREEQVDQVEIAGAEGASFPPAQTTSPAEQLTASGNVLVTAIPTEVLAPYTAIVGIIVSTIDGNDPNRETMRWIVFAAGIFAVALWLGIAYVRRSKEEKKRHFPIAETAAALVAFAAWGLVMPGSPLSLTVTGDDLTIWTAIITIGGGFLVGVVLGSPLKKSIE